MMGNWEVGRWVDACVNDRWMGLGWMGEWRVNSGW